MVSHARFALEVAKGLSRNFQCFHCAAPTHDFLPSQPGDVPVGATLQAVILLGPIS
jgi:hypothetical protein